MAGHIISMLKMLSSVPSIFAYKSIIGSRAGQRSLTASWSQNTCYTMWMNGFTHYKGIS